MPAPHIGVRLSTARMSWMVCLCLLPSALWGVFLFGLPALGVLGISIGTAALAELAATLPFRRFTLADGSAVLTGCIIGLLCPRACPCTCRQRRLLSASSSSNRPSAAWGRTG